VDGRVPRVGHLLPHSCATAYASGPSARHRSGLLQEPDGKHSDEDAGWIMIIAEVWRMLADDMFLRVIRTKKAIASLMGETEEA